MAPITNSTSLVTKRWSIWSPIQRNWDKIEPVKNTYMNILTGLGTIFAVASTIAIIAQHGWKLPKWPFAQKHWKPEPADHLKDDWEGPKEFPEMTEEEALAWEKEYEEDGYKAASKGKGVGKRRKGWQRIWEDEGLFENLQGEWR